MKVGLILECGPEGADVKVCNHLISTFFPSIDLAKPVTLDNKPNLIDRCGRAAANLLADGCDFVIIMWDLYPAWRENHASPCRHADRERIRESLNDAEVAVDKAFLVCVEEELEAWLLADGRALSAFLSRPTRPVAVKDEKRPDQVRKPKTRLTEIMQNHGRGRYIDYVHAILIAKEITDLSKIRKSPTFCRFVLKVTGERLH